MTRRARVLSVGTSFLTLCCSPGLAFYDGEKKVKAVDLKIGERVSVEARPAPDNTFDAVTVRLERRKS